MTKFPYGMTLDSDEEENNRRRDRPLNYSGGRDVDMGIDLDPIDEDSPRPFGAKLALLVVVLVGTALGIGGGLAVDPGFFAVPVAILGGVGVARATRAVAAGDNVRRAKGSLGVMASVLVLVGAIGATGHPTAFLVTAAMGVAGAGIGMGALVGVGSDPSDHVRRTVRRSSVVLGVAAFAAALVYSGVLWTLAVVTVQVSVYAIGAYAFSAFVALQVLGVVVVGLIELAVPILDDWTSADDEKSELLQTWEENGVSLGDVRATTWGVLAFEILLAIIPGVNSGIQTVLGVIPVLGPVVSTILQSGVVHVPLALVGMATSLVLVARGIQWGIVTWAGRSPPQALSYAAGAISLSVIGAPLAIPQVGGVLVSVLLDSPVGSVGALETAALVGPAAFVYGSIALVLGGTYVTLSLAPVVSAVARIPPGSGNFGAGAGLLFGAGVATVLAGAHPVLAFIATAGALLVWDLGENAVGLVDQVGPSLDTRGIEITHAAGSVLVGASAVALATATYYLLGWVSIPTPANPTNAFMAMVLTLVAILAFSKLVGDAGAES